MSGDSGDKLFKAAWALGFWMLGCLAPAPAQAGEWRVTLDMQMVAIPPEKAIQLIPALRDAVTFDKAFADLQRMIERDEAELVAWPVLVTEGKSRSPEHPLPLGKAADSPAEAPAEITPPTSESIVEMRFPAEFFVPSAPQSFGSIPPLSDLLRINPGFVISPMAFETINVGAMLWTEDQIVVSENGDFVELTIKPRRVASLKSRNFQAMVNPSGVQGIFYSPRFLWAEMSSRLAVHSGRRMFLGVFAGAKSETNVLLYLLKVVTRRTAGQSPPP